MLTLDWHGEQLALLAERAVHWARQRAVIVADLHLGKPDTFRAAGIPVPAALTGATLNALNGLISLTGAEKLIVLGDLLHARAGRSGDLAERFTAWRDRHRDLEILLVRGNHDAAAGDPPPSWAIACADAPFGAEPFALFHRPPQGAAGPCIAGHVHPAVSVTGHGGGRRPCFHLSGGCLVLPAFGSFTGTHRVEALPGDRVFAIDTGEVVEVTALLCRSRRARARS